jgi:prephenate dehydrogenase
LAVWRCVRCAASAGWGGLRWRRWPSPCSGWGYSPLPAESVAALKSGAITEIAQDTHHLAATADLVVLAAPPGAILTLLQQLGPELLARRVLCTDTASVKQPVVALAERLGLGAVFAGSHPYAGTHESGFAAARPSMLHRAVVYVTPLADGEAAAREIGDFWAAICEAAPVVGDAADHDAILGWTSHLPQAVASALAAALARSGPHASYGGGARDTTRLAASNTALWHDILLSNREPVLRGLEAMEDELGRLRQALAAGDSEALTAWLDFARTWRRRQGP